MFYQYDAIGLMDNSQQPTIINGVVEAQSFEYAVALIISKGLKPLSIKSLNSSEAKLHVRLQRLKEKVSPRPIKSQPKISIVKKTMSFLYDIHYGKLLILIPIILVIICLIIASWPR